MIFTIISSKASSIVHFPQIEKRNSAWLILQGTRAPSLTSIERNNQKKDSPETLRRKYSNYLVQKRSSSVIQSAHREHTQDSSKENLLQDKTEEKVEPER